MMDTKARKDKRIRELEAQLDTQKDEYEGLIDVAESNYKKLEAQLADRDMLYEAGITAAREEIAKLQAQLESKLEAVRKELDADHDGCTCGWCGVVDEGTENCLWCILKAAIGEGS